MSRQDESTSQPSIERANAILNFWFGDPSNPASDYGQQRKVWFKKDPDFDATIRQQFQPDYEAARQGHFTSWRHYPRLCLALILLLDQVPRNIFRGTPQSFETDDQALATAKFAVEQGLDQVLIPVEKIFLYLPFEHSENLADQDTSVTLFENLVQTHPELESTLDYARRHRAIIQQFGRFPHRNSILHRATTPAEADFLKQPGSRF